MLAASDFTFKGYLSVPNGIYPAASLIYATSLTHRFNSGIRFLMPTFASTQTWDVVELSLPGGLTSASFTGSSTTPVATLSGANLTNYWSGANVFPMGNSAGFSVGIWWEDSTVNPNYTGSPRLWATIGVLYPGAGSGVDLDSMTSAVSAMTLNNGSPGTVSNFKGYYGFEGVDQRCVMGTVCAVPSWLQTEYGINPYMYGPGQFCSLTTEGGLSSFGSFFLAGPDVTTITTNSNPAVGNVAPLSLANWSTAGTGTVSIASGSHALTTSVSNPAGMTIGNYLGISGDSSNGGYQVASGSGTSWTITQAYGGSGNASGASWTYTKSMIGTYADWTIPTSMFQLLADHRSGQQTPDWSLDYTGSGYVYPFNRGQRSTPLENFYDGGETYTVTGTASCNLGSTALSFGTAQTVSAVVGNYVHFATDSDQQRYLIQSSADSQHFTLATAYEGNANQVNVTGCQIGYPGNGVVSNTVEAAWYVGHTPFGPPLGNGQWLSPMPDGNNYWVVNDTNSSALWIDGPNKYGCVAVAALAAGWFGYLNSAVNSGSQAVEIHGYDPATLAAAIASGEPWLTQPAFMKQITSDLNPIGLQPAGSNLAGPYSAPATFDGTSAGPLGAPTLWIYLPQLNSTGNGALVAYQVNC